jgi:uncharacterized RDD family membrane protein YckC
MTQPSGWYDDPQDPSKLRYWDGVIWSNHVTPKVSPTVEQSNIGMPYGVTPAAGRPEGSGSHGAQGPLVAPGGYVPPQQDAGRGQPGGQWPAQGQHPGQLPPDQLGWQSHPPKLTTPDGVVLSGWWKRVLARIIDDIIIWFLALPLTFVPMKRVFDIFGDYFRQAMAAAEAGATLPDQPTAELTGPILQVTLTMLAVYLVYEIAFLTLTGATLGKRIVGISVRLRDKPGPPPLAAVLKRTAVKEGGNLVGSVPFLGLFGSLFSLVNVLWPLWDDKKQAIHDKVGATNVVVGRQPKRDT